MLTDITMNMALNILREQFAHMGGLQDVTLGPISQFDICAGEFVQICIDLEREHWVCIASSQMNELDVYDSLNPNTLPSDLEKQIRSIVNDTNKQYSINIKDVQEQENGVDCGVFSIAFATSLLHGEDPMGLSYDTTSLRTHLLTCLNNQRFDLFPKLLQNISFADIMPIPNQTNLSKNRKHAEILTEMPGSSKTTNQSTTNVTSTITHEFYCNMCGGKYEEPISEDWVQCSVCKDWCHERCYDKKPNDRTFICDFCAVVV